MKNDNQINQYSEIKDLLGEHPNKVNILDKVGVLYIQWMERRSESEYYRMQRDCLIERQKPMDEIIEIDNLHFHTSYRCPVCKNNSYNQHGYCPYCGQRLNERKKD